MSTAAHQRLAVIVDEHPLWLDSVEQALRRADVEVAGRATSPSHAVALVEELEPDVVVTGLNTPDGEMSGLDFVRSVRERSPQTKVVVLSMHASSSYIDGAFAAGAHAYVLKTTHAEDLIAAVRQAFRHSIYLAASRPSAPTPAPDSDGSFSLTPREREILALVAEGKSNAQVARTLWVTEQTVKFHLSNIYRKLDVANRTEASRFAHRRGLLAGAESEMPAPLSATA